MPRHCRLEGSSVAVHDYLVARVTSADNLHNIEQLHQVNPAAALSRRS
jgi:hypothetical protein